MSFLEKLWPRAAVATLVQEVAALKAENKALSIATRNALDAATAAREKANDAMTAQIQAQDKLIVSMQQMTNYNAFVMGSKIPVFPGVGPERPKIEDVPQEQMPELVKRPRNFRDKMTPEALTAILSNEWNQANGQSDF